MSINSEKDLEGMQQAAKVVKEALAAMQKAIEPGVTTHELNAICGRIFAYYGAVSAPQLTYGAPVNAFISVNNTVVHSLPNGRRLQGGDIENRCHSIY